MRVLVCGSRSFADKHAVWDVLNGLYATASCGWLTTDAMPFVVIEGGAKGADYAARTWVIDCPLHGEPVKLDTYDPVEYVDHGWGVPVSLLEFPADWNVWGKKAGYIRNARMLEEGKPDAVWAFVDKPLLTSKGTAMMCKIATDAGVPVYVVQRLNPELSAPPEKHGADFEGFAVRDEAPRITGT